MELETLNLKLCEAPEFVEKGAEVAEALEAKV